MATNDWDSALYEDRHSFVWKAGSGLVDLLQPVAGQRILDLGCGTGQLTATIAESGALVIGMDASPSMVAQARQNYPKLKFVLADARTFAFDEPFEAVFSNAVLHWIGEPERVIERVAAALKPNGRFVLEMGGKGNCERILNALESQLRQLGVAFQRPFYYPSVADYTTLLEKHGFELAFASMFPRWTKLEHPERGLREWLEMFAQAYFKELPAADREPILRAVEEQLRPTMRCDGHWWADYRRLRIAAVLRPTDSLPG